ncbi:MAG: iron-sulfur cluster assembly accessory protein [Gammaproteobacteria bacterium]|nr:MAG: iron-sulfur cluster assembly accessory protein [Gammaproteobacteria bacterium]
MSLSIYTPNESAAISITDKAVTFFKKKLANSEHQAIRISVKKSGCTGYAYVIDYGEKQVEGDSRYQFDDLTVFVSAQAMTMIVGSEIDLVQQGLNQSITFNNPNVTASCGCGSSFSVDATDDQ